MSREVIIPNNHHTSSWWFFGIITCEGYMISLVTHDEGSKLLKYYSFEFSK